MASPTHTPDMNLSPLWERVKAEEPGTLQSLGLPRVRHDLMTEHHHHHQCLMTKPKQILTGMVSLGLLIILCCLHLSAWHAWGRLWGSHQAHMLRTAWQWGGSSRPWRREHLPDRKPVGNGGGWGPRGRGRLRARTGLGVHRVLPLRGHVPWRSYLSPQSLCVSPDDRDSKSSPQSTVHSDSGPRGSSPPGRGWRGDLNPRGEGARSTQRARRQAVLGRAGLVPLPSLSPRLRPAGQESIVRAAPQERPFRCLPPAPEGRGPQGAHCPRHCRCRVLTGQKAEVKRPSAAESGQRGSGPGRKRGRMARRDARARGTFLAGISPRGAESTIAGSGLRDRYLLNASW